MTTSTVLNKEQQTLLKPDEDLMFDREGFDRPSIRQEFAPVQEIDPSTRYVEQGNAYFISPDSDNPIGPTATGESFGNIELVKASGGVIEIPRYTHGFTVDTEDEEVDTTWLTDARDGIMELFDIQADYAFLQGLVDEQGNDVFKGVFEWLDDEMPSANKIDCDNFDLSAGDLQGVPANIITKEAYGNVTGEYVETQWDLAVAKHSVWADWNSYGTFDGAMVESQWDLVQADRNDAAVGVNRRILIPESIGLRGPSDGGDLQRPIEMPDDDTTSDNDDVMYLIPQHDGDFYELYEQASPDVRGPIMKEGFKERWEYKWRAGVVQGQTQKRDNEIAQDAIKLQNVSNLFA